MKIKEIFKEYSNCTSLAEGHYDYMMDEEDFTNACKILISFHVEAALKEASEKVDTTCLADRFLDNYDSEDDAEGNIFRKKSILNAYPLNLIK